jgi:hypothetical protein
VFGKRLIFALLTCFLPSLALGAPVNRAVSWNLADWLSQKRQIQLMDLWLTQNRETNLVDFYLGGGPLTYNLRTDDGTLTTRTYQRALSYRAAFYVGFVGVEGEYENTDHNTSSWSAAAGLRLLGSSSQDTNLTLKYGVRQFTDESNEPRQQWSNRFAQGNLDLHLIDVFGLSGSYRPYFEDKTDDGTVLDGDKITGGAFIDVSLIRLYGEYFRENMKRVSATKTTHEDRDGFEFGARLYF